MAKLDYTKYANQRSRDFGVGIETSHFRTFIQAPLGYIGTALLANTQFGR